jgi:hypothetical protein
MHYSNFDKSIKFMNQNNLEILALKCIFKIGFKNVNL